MTVKELNIAWSMIRQVAERNGVSPEEVRNEISACINAAWSNPSAKTTQKHLFPNGKPTPEALIIKLAKICQQEI